MVRGVAVSADGRRVVSGSNDHTVKVWEKHLGELVWQRVEAKQPEPKAKKSSLLDTPVVIWTPEEEATAHRVMQLFRNHDE